jgi:anti-sigma-K factor RskA
MLTILVVVTEKLTMELWLIMKRGSSLSVEVYPGVGEAHPEVRSSPGVVKES